MNCATSRPQDSSTLTPLPHNLLTMAPPTSNAERNNLLTELRKNSIPDVETVQDLYSFYFPHTLNLASEKMEDGLWALGCSIEHQLDIPQRPGKTIRQGLAQIHEDLMEIVPAYPYFTVLDKLSLIVYFYLLQFNYKRRLAIVQPEPLSSRFIACVPYEDFTVGDHRYDDVLWLYYDDRRADYFGVDPLFAGVCIPERDSLPYHRGCILDKSSPSVFAVFAGQKEILVAGSPPQTPTTNTHSSDDIGIDVEKFLDLCFPDIDNEREEEEISYGPTPQIPPRNAHPNDDDVADMSSAWSSAEDEAASSDEDKDSEVAFSEPDPASKQSNDADIDDSVRILCGTPGEDDTLSSPRSTSPKPQATPPPNAPTGPATVCWNCSGIGHLSSKYHSIFSYSTLVTYGKS